MAKYIRPSLETKFHIDFSWWKQKNQNLSSYLLSHACPSCQALVEESEANTFDWIDPETGEIHQIDLIWHHIYTHCQDDPAFFDKRIPLTSAIFRAFIANNNTPLTSVEIYKKIQKKNPYVILSTIGKRRIYRGIKAVTNSL